MEEENNVRGSLLYKSLRGRNSPKGWGDCSGAVCTHTSSLQFAVGHKEGACVGGPEIPDFMRELAEGRQWVSEMGGGRGEGGQRRREDVRGRA